MRICLATQRDKSSKLEGFTIYSLLSNLPSKFIDGSRAVAVAVSTVVQLSQINRQYYFREGEKLVQRELSVIFHTFSLPLLGCFAQRVCVCVYTLVLSYFSFGETKSFCSTIVTHFVVGDLCQNVRWFIWSFVQVFLTKLCLYMLHFVTVKRINKLNL